MHQRWSRWRGKANLTSCSHWAQASFRFQAATLLKRYPFCKVTNSDFSPQGFRFRRRRAADKEGGLQTLGVSHKMCSLSGKLHILQTRFQAPSSSAIRWKQFSKDLINWEIRFHCASFLLIPFPLTLIYTTCSCGAVKNKGFKMQVLGMEVPLWVVSSPNTFDFKSTIT